MNLEEVWKDILGLEGTYQISNTGKVKSLTRSVDTSYVTKTGKTATRITMVKGKTLKPSVTRSGYLRLDIKNTDKRLFKSISIGLLLVLFVMVTKKV